MITPEQHAEIRRLYYGEHWKVGTIAAALGVHHDTVRAAIAHDTQGVRRGDVPRDTARSLPAVSPRHAGAVSAPAGDAALRDAARPRLRRVRGAAPARRARAAAGRHRRPCIAASSPCRPRRRRSTGARFGRFGSATACARSPGFVMVLSYSRALFALFTVDQTLESFLRGHVEAFDAWQGVARTLVVRQPAQRGARARRHGHSLSSAAAASSPATITSRRGRVRRHAAMRRARSSGRSSTSATPSLRPGRLPDVDDLNAQFRRWRDEIAHQRPHPEQRDRTVAAGLRRGAAAPLCRCRRIPSRPS